MKVTQCDACGCTYNPYIGNEETGNSNGLLLVNFDKKGRYEKQGYFDLCQDCARKLASFLNKSQDIVELKQEVESPEYINENTTIMYENEKPVVEAKPLTTEETEELIHE